MNDCKVIYRGKTFCSDSMEDALEQAYAFEADRQQQLRPLYDLARGTFRYDSKYNSIEIYFPRKPHTAVLSELSENGWRWHNAKRCWYAKLTAENERLARDICAINSDAPEQVHQSLRLELKHMPPSQDAWFRAYESGAEDQCRLHSHKLHSFEGWSPEYDLLTSEQIKTLLEENERARLYHELPSDYFRKHNTPFSYDSDLDYLRKLAAVGREFEEYYDHLSWLVRDYAEKLRETAYWCAVSKYESERSLQHHATKEHPMGLKESSFWENFRIFGDNLQPIDIARNMGCSYTYDWSKREWIFRCGGAACPA